MARPKRFLYENAVYHVTSRGNERHSIFWSDKDRVSFLRILGEAVHENRVLIHAWVLMPNHYHLLVETPEKNLPSFMAYLNGVYTLNFNKRHERVGHLFQGRYKSIHVAKDAYLQRLCRYIVLNPLKTKPRLAEHPADWRWSSYRATAGLTRTPDWLEVDWVLGQFSKNRRSAMKSYRSYVAEGMSRAEDFWEGKRRTLFLGGEDFLARMRGIAQEKDSLDMPKYQRLKARPGMEEILGKVARVFRVEVPDLRARRWKGNLAGNIAIYLLKGEHGYSLREIGRWFGIRASAIGNRWCKVKRSAADDPRLAGMIERCKM